MSREGPRGLRVPTHILTHTRTHTPIYVPTLKATHLSIAPHRYAAPFSAIQVLHAAGADLTIGISSSSDDERWEGTSSEGAMACDVLSLAVCFGHKHIIKWMAKNGFEVKYAVGREVSSWGVRTNVCVCKCVGPVV